MKHYVSFIFAAVIVSPREVRIALKSSGLQYARRLRQVWNFRGRKTDHPNRTSSWKAL